MKRIFCVFLSLILCLSMVSCSDSEETKETSGETEDVASESISEVEESSEEADDNKGFLAWLNKDVKEFEFELNEDQTEYILVEYNYLSNDASAEAIIPSTYEGLPVTEIASQAFYACEQIESVIIPEGITCIGPYAFYLCDNLKNIIIPQSVSVIEEYAFEECDALTSISIPQSVDIGFRAFYGCDNLESVVLGDDNGWLYCIEDYAFYECPNLETVTLGECYSAIGDNAFAYCESLSVVNLPGGVKKIGSSAFEHCESLTEINFAGTMNDWEDIDKWSWWDKDTGHYEIICAK